LRGDFVGRLDATFSTWVPERGGVLNIKDFRPISLGSSVYKILSKVLAKRLECAMLWVLFRVLLLKERRIPDAAFIANELVVPTKG